MLENPVDSEPWISFRNAMPVSKRWAYLDHAAIGPLPQAAADEMAAWAEQAVNDGDHHWPRWQEKIDSLRSVAAELVNAHPNEISIIPNTTFGINLVANGLPWKPGDNVVSAAGEFPTNRYPWLNLARLGVETRLVPRAGGEVCLNQIADACDERTRLISLSWITYDTGFRIDVKTAAEIAHRNGALFLLDAIQGMGVFPLDVRETNIDFFAADGHKWMLGPEGAGLFYIKQALLDQLVPHSIGWRSVVDEWNFGTCNLDFKPQAARFEGGTSNTVGSIGLLASLQVLQQSGLSSSSNQLADRVLQLADLLHRRLADLGHPVDRAFNRENRSGIVAFNVSGRDADSIQHQLSNQGVILSCRNEKLRAAVHAYNDESDIQRLTEAIAKLG